MTPLRVVRLALLLSVLGFGAVVWYLRRAGYFTDTTVSPNVLVVTGRVIWGGALVACVFLFLRTRRVEIGPPGSATIAPWAIGETTALFGGIVYLLTGVFTWYLMGVFFFGLTLFAFPAQRTGG